MPFASNVLTGDVLGRMTASSWVEIRWRGSRQLTTYGSESVWVRDSSPMGTSGGHSMTHSTSLPCG
jgi:hypothetical protein